MDDNNTNLDPMEETEKPSGQPIAWIIIGVAALGCGILFAAAFFFFQPDAKSLVAQYFPSPTATLTSTPTHTPTITHTPTSTSTPTNTPTPTPNMTAQAYEATAVYAAGEWNESVSETFEKNNDRWYVGTDDGDYAKIIYEVKDGKYVWDATAHQGFVQRMTVNSVSIGDFYFSMEARQPGFTTAADYGIIFREDSSSNYYYFNVNNKGQFSLWLHNKDEWTVLIEETKSSAILPREVNKLSIIAEGDHFIFFINDQYAAEIHDGTLAKGEVGFGAEISGPDLNIVFEFDNITLRRPK